MKKLLVLLLAVMMVVGVFAGCQKAEAPAATEAPADAATEAPAMDDAEAMYADGVYYARDEIGPSWTYFVIITVDGGKITDAYWAGTNFVPQGNKREQSEAGTYGMVAYGGAQSFWYEQAEAAEKWLIENQDPTAFEELYTDEEGHTSALTTDGGASVSVHVKEFFELAAKALASDPVPAGKYGDAPVVTVMGEPSENGWKDLAEFIVVNGTIVACDYDALYSKELVTEGDDANAKYFVIDDEGKGTPQSKDQLKEAYGMTAAGSSMEWYQQAEAMEAYVVENQDIFPVNEEGYTDAVSGVSIHAVGFYSLFNQAFGE